MRKMIFLLLLFSLLISCSQQERKHKVGEGGIDIHKPMSWGHQQTIYIFADDNVWKYAESYLRKSLERYQFTTENETYFEIKRTPYKSIEQFYKFNNLIFFCDIESNEEVSAYVKNIIGKKVQDEVKINSVGIYPKNNLWANDQYILFILGDNEENLLKLNILQSNEIFDLFKNKLYERITRKVYKLNIYPENIFAGFPGKIKIPKNYILYKKDIDNNFISFIARGKDKPDRYISFYYENMDMDNVDKVWLKKKRAKIAWDYYDEDEFYDKDIKIEKSELGENKCWKLSGRWQNKKYAAGGAFQSFAFYDKDSKLAILIDNSVYFPEGYKLAALIELEVISETFCVKD